MRDDRMKELDRICAREPRSGKRYSPPKPRDKSRPKQLRRIRYLLQHGREDEAAAVKTAMDRRHEILEQQGEAARKQNRAGGIYP
jgi:hypothetical protein